MSTPTTVGPVTVRDVLFDGRQVDPVSAIEDSLHRQGAVPALVGGAGRLTGAGGRAVEHEVAAVLDRLLALDLLDLAAGGWARHSALRAAARRTRDAPGSEEVVTMARHRISSSHRPGVELLVDGVPVGVLELALEVSFEVEALVAVVRRARLMSARTARCTVAGSLAAHGHVLAERRLHYDLPGAVRLRHGVRLLRS
ncbi:hypothetical protein [Kitasatospora terrestris]|uniref:Transcriptional regulator n=1 Tax=Kitasatospora terrestris TaxID=258051 RepID=A0ABP9DL95_9ACTN